MSFRPPNAAGKPVGTAAFRAQLAQCTSAAHRWNLQEHACAASKPAPLPPCPSRTDAGYADFEEAYELGKAPKWTHASLVSEEDIRGRNDREGTGKIPKEPDALTCPICLEDLDEKTSTMGPFGRAELEILQELTEQRRASDPEASQVCGHAFHKNCLAGWIKKKKFKCPICRQPIANGVITRIGQLSSVPENKDSDDESEEDLRERVEMRPSNAAAELAFEQIEEIFENADSWFDDETDTISEAAMIQEIQITITNAVANSNQNSVYVKYILFIDYGDIMIRAAKAMRLNDVAQWLGRSRSEAERAFLAIEDMLFLV